MTNLSRAAPALVACPTCKGSKRVTVTVITHDKGRQESSVEMDCHICDGAGVISPATARAIALMDESWCRCDNPSGGATYHADNERGAACSKHHWTCDDCGKIRQAG